ncbi:helix-turn-helix domain-containing protein [Pseudarthrobacter sp. H3Y2-7]|uniref:helix-turn-helix domain-containing protein n=1 Tax=Pseudarthrobacter naphthalenicus TaxID=3031328 RepID=UPI0023AF47B9|nr:helix-turn-helix domain-containing protein [Pseudarthrobacter sp. H3Y2-7]MDE8670504.1 helix-turn-helix domain-containing protein [Pseudarthrobacter sp. H3Y2-7]
MLREDCSIRLPKLRLLLMFKERQFLRLPDAAHELGVSASTAHRSLAMLRSYGFIRQEPGVRTCVPGSVLLDLGPSAVWNMDVGSLARPILADLALRLDESVHLAVLEGDNVRDVYSVEGPRATANSGSRRSGVPCAYPRHGGAMPADLPPDHLAGTLARARCPGRRYRRPRSAACSDPPAGLRSTLVRMASRPWR